MLKLWQPKQRIKTPTMIQMDAAECGAISLAIVMAYYGYYLLPEEARTAVGVSRDGSKAINIIKAARHYGMEAEGYNIETIDELKEMQFPFIAFWEFNHFLVVEGFSKDKVYLNDPATGPRVITIEEFEQSYTGVILELTPGIKFQKGGKRQASIINELWQRLYKDKKAFSYIILATLILIIPSLAVPVFAKIFIDHILIAEQHSWFLPLIAAMIFVAIVVTILTWLQQRYILRFNMKLQLAGTANFFWHLLHLPMNFFQQRSTGDISERTEVNEKVAEIVATGLTQNVVGAITIVLYATLMLLLNWILALIVIFISATKFMALIYINRRLTDMGRRYAQDRGKLNGIEMHGMQIIETIKANALESQFFTRWSAHHAKTINSQQRIEIYSSLLDILPTLLSGLSTIILLSLGTYFIIQGNLTIGTLIALQLLLSRFNAPLTELLNLGGQIQELRGDIVRVNDVLNQEVDHIVGNQSGTNTDLIDVDHKPILAIRALYFGYSRMEPPIFADFSLDLAAGERIAIVGSSGSGKSSLAKLVCGLYPIWQGEIRIQGKLLAQIPREKLATILGVVDQKIFLFEGSVRDNLTLWNNSIPDADLHRALQDACIDDIIIDRGGLDCAVQEGGSNFSGGQCQRIEIARALSKNPKLLILDEATSAIDPINEKKIYANLKQRGCSLFIIAHRLSTIRDCDKIVVIEEGEIAQMGKHAELVQQDGIYQDLIRLEESWG